MILGLSVAAYTTLHVIISIVAILSGVVVVLAMDANRRLDALTAVFLVTTALTSLGGFLFHSKMIGPPHIVGVISLLDLAIAIWALYVAKLAGVWRAIYAATATIALYFNVFVLVVQAFDKIGVLHALAPTGKEPPLAAAQGVTLIVFIVLGVLAVRRYRPAPG